jgi:hypothetical protein
MEITTKKLVYLGVPHNRYAEFQFDKYLFTFTKELQPIAVEVPSNIAEVLLQMTGRIHSCCKRKKPNKLFKEVK